MDKVLWNDLNTLLTFLREFYVVGLVAKRFYSQHGNSAPHTLLADQIQTVQKHLDKKDEVEGPGITLNGNMTIDDPGMGLTINPAVTPKDLSNGTTAAP